MDSGFNIYLYNNRDYFFYQRLSAPDNIVILGKILYKIEAFGIYKISILIFIKEYNIIELQDITLIPNFIANLVSFSKAN